MIAHLHPYPEYRESEQAWLGRVPQHWLVLPNRALFAEVKERDNPDEEMLSVTITQGVIRQKSLLAGTSKKDSSNLDKSAYKLVCPRDIAYNKMRAWQGAIGVSDFRGIVSPAYVVMRVREEQSARYYHYLYRTPHFAKEAERWSYGITSDMWSLRPEHFKMIYTALPPLPEQSTIVRFIDHFDRRINWLIRAKRRLIALLNEQKQAIIHRAVTRGLDPNVHLKPSGVDWLGDVPEHWQMFPLKYLSRHIQNGATPPTEERSYYENGSVPWYGPSSINDNMDVGKPVRFLSKKAFTDGKARRINAPALMVVVIGATAGRIGLLMSEGSCNQQITSFELRTERIESLFVAYQFNQAESWLRAMASSATIPIIDSGRLVRSPIVLPPIDEQRLIIAYFDVILEPFQKSIDRTHHEINLLREYRTRLIADVVMGKLDVRGVETPALEEAEAFDELDTGKEAEADDADYTEEVAD